MPDIRPIVALHALAALAPGLAFVLAAVVVR